MQERMATGRFKVAKQLTEFWDEYRMYHRKDGVIVKLRDDILSATRIAIMAKNHAKNVALGHVAGREIGEQKIAQGLDFDVFAT
jgi:hypothetical protein